MRGRIAKKICKRTDIFNLFGRVDKNGRVVPYSIEQICTALSLRNLYYRRKHLKRNK